MADTDDPTGHIDAAPDPAAPDDPPSVSPNISAPSASRGQKPRLFIGPFTRGQFVTVVVVVNVVGLLLLLVTRPLTGSSLPPTRTIAAGASFYVVGAQTQGLQVGDRAPDFAAADGSDRLTGLDGKPITIAGLAGRPIWVIFWATWCPPCQTETPDIERTWEAYRANGLAIVAVDIQEPAEIVADYVRTYSLTYQVELDPTASVMKTYAVFGLPTHYFIGIDGTVRDRYLGPLTGAQMRERVGPLIGPAP